MRKWIKYDIDSSHDGVKRLPMDNTFAEIEAAIGPYCPDEAYKSKKDFFNKYYFGYHRGRLQCYDDFLRKRLGKKDTILSIASGRCANELLLLDEGYDIACSDLEIIDVRDSTKALFPDFRFMKLDILNGPAPDRYDKIICLSLIYLFDDQKLEIFFGNISRSLREGGHLILDSAGSPDSLLSFFINDVWLRFEANFYSLKSALGGRKRRGITIKHHGFRRSDKEIVETAKRYGLSLVGRKDYGELIEFRRSRIFNKFVKPDSAAEKLFSFLGKRVPYIRMYDFTKVQPEVHASR